MPFAITAPAQAHLPIAASDLASAKDIQEVLAHQSRFAQAQMQAYALQAQELGRLVAEAMQGLQKR